jgi:hypothetical protein
LSSGGGTWRKTGEEGVGREDRDKWMELVVKMTHMKLENEVKKMIRYEITTSLLSS